MLFRLVEVDLSCEKIVKAIQLEVKKHVVQKPVDATKKCPQAIKLIKRLRLKAIDSDDSDDIAAILMIYGLAV